MKRSSIEASSRTFSLIDIFLVTSIIALITAFVTRYPLPGFVITMSIVAAGSFTIGHPRLATAFMRHRYRLMILIVVLYLVPWLSLYVGF